MIEPPDMVREYFEAAGWYRGRSVPVFSVPRDHIAWEVLTAFSGLKIVERTTNDPIEELVFRELLPWPLVTDRWSDLLGTQLIGIADHHNGHGELYIAADGRCFCASCVHDAFCFVGDSLFQATETILLGRRSKPMLRPDQDSVRLYGERFVADSPELYRYG